MNPNYRAKIDELASRMLVEEESRTWEEQEALEATMEAEAEEIERELTELEREMN